MIEKVLAFIFGVLLGVVIERSQFCMASAFRDFFLFRHTSMLKAIIVALAVTSTGFLIFSNAGFIVDYPYIVNAGLNTAIGGIFFGIGMVLAGGCASGTLYRVGEGYTTSMVALVGMLVGIAGFAEVYSLLKSIFIDPTSIGKLTLQGVIGTSEITAYFLFVSVLAISYFLIARRYSK